MILGILLSFIQSSLAQIPLSPAIDSTASGAVLDTAMNLPPPIKFVHGLQEGVYKGKHVGRYVSVAGEENKVRGRADFIVYKVEKTETLLGILIAEGGFAHRWGLANNEKFSENRRVVVYALEPIANSEIRQGGRSSSNENKIISYKMYPYRLDTMRSRVDNQVIYTGGVSTTRQPTLVLTVGTQSDSGLSFTMVTTNSGDKTGGTFSLEFNSQEGRYVLGDPEGGAIYFKGVFSSSEKLGQFVPEGGNILDGTQSGKLVEFGHKGVPAGQYKVFEARPGLFTVSMETIENSGSTLSSKPSRFMLILGKGSGKVAFLVNPEHPHLFQTIKFVK